jgi:hypothetical protein
MSTLFKAEVMNAEATGAGYGAPAGLYFTGVGVAFSKSPQKALRHAERLAAHDLNRDLVRQGQKSGVGWIPVYGYTRLYKGDKLILEED